MQTGFSSVRCSVPWIISATVQSDVSAAKAKDKDLSELNNLCHHLRWISRRQQESSFARSVTQ